MSITTYRIGGSFVRDDEPGFEEEAAKAHNGSQRPLCMCSGVGIEMYVARIGGRHFIKRMPNTGAQHMPACEHFEPPAELSGLGQLEGTAIQESVEEGITTLKLGFSLSRGAGRAAPSLPSVESNSVKSDGNKMSLRAVADYLIEQAGFNRWSPAMEGKRSYYTWRKYLLRAAQNKRAKGKDLAEVLYIPEPFNMNEKSEIAQRRMAMFGKVAGAHKAGRDLMMVIGLVKEIEASRYGYRFVLKHLPDCAFSCNEDMKKRLDKRFAGELAMWDSTKEGIHLLLVGTFAVNLAFTPMLEEVALVTTTSSWIPFESMFEKALVDTLIERHRRFTKGLRYNLPRSRPLASAVLSDTEQAVALYVVPPGSEAELVAATESLIAESQMMSWRWRADETVMPELPQVCR